MALDLATVKAQRPRVCFELVPGATLGAAMKDAFGHLWTALYTSTCCPVGVWVRYVLHCCAAVQSRLILRSPATVGPGCALVKGGGLGCLASADRVAHALLLTAGDVVKV